MLIIFNTLKNIINTEIKSKDRKYKGKSNYKNGDNMLRILEELELLIGLQKVKELIKEIRAFLEIRKRRIECNLRTDHLVLHMIFKGNPGTGKTTVARLFSKLFTELNVLSKGHLVEVERADLVGEYIGHTAQKTRIQIKQALGGILFVDEAYSLARGGEKDFGKEAIDTLVKAMEDYRTNFILILAGYRMEMDYFLSINPGLNSRFPIQIDFPDYNLYELIAIAELIAEQRQYRLSKGAKNFLKNYLMHQLNQYPINFGNARLVRNLIERAIRRQALRLMCFKKLSRDDLMIITREDF